MSDGELVCLFIFLKMQSLCNPLTCPARKSLAAVSCPVFC